MNRECHFTAAKMLGDGDPGLLHHKLHDYLTAIDDMVKRVGGSLKSRQIIAVICNQWIDANPNEKAYGD